MSQYKFVGTNERQTEVPLPSEAMTFGGITIENEIDGYRTLSVSGREIIETDIESIRIGGADGEKFAMSRKVPKLITVNYQLVAGSPQDFRSKFNRLNKVLDKTQVPFSFADEPDKYFVGSKSDVDTVPVGVNQIVSSFDIYCSSPFKVSKATKNFKNTNRTVKVQNDGTYRTYGKAKITFKSECGFILIANGDKAVMFGKPDEADGEIVQKSKVIVKDDFDKTPLAWKVNQNPKAVRNNATLSGSYTIANSQATPVYGNGAGVHGPTMVIDVDGEPTNWTYDLWVLFNAVSNKSMGRVEINLLDKNDKFISGIALQKNTTNETVLPIFYTGDINEKYGDVFTKEFKNFRGNIKIYKFANKFTFEVNQLGGYSMRPKTYQHTALTDAKVAKIAISCLAFGNNPTMDTKINLAVLTGHNTNVWQDIPNQFQPNDVMEIDYSSGDVTLNGAPYRQIGDIGNSFDPYEVGETLVNYDYSNWVVTPPELEIEIRERWL